MKVSDYIIKFFEEKEVGIIFGYVGGMITHLVDSIHLNKNVQFVQTYHEQSSSIAAEGYALETQNIGVAISTSGPGATNMITGIADAYFDSIPVFYITGQVNTYEYKDEKPIRQLGFQETDIVNIVKPIVKYSVLIKDEKNIRYELEKAYYTATSGRPGPVLLDIPMNIQRAEVDIENLKGFDPKELKVNEQVTISLLEEAVELIKNAKRPMILCGGGVFKDESKRALNEFSESNRIPIVTSLKGRGLCDEESELYFGMIGSYGNRNSNISIANCDLLIALGTRLDTRQTGANYKEFVKAGKIIHVDIDEDELEYNRISNRLELHMDVKDFLIYLNKKEGLNNKNSDWIDYLNKIKEKYNQDAEIQKNIENKSPYELIDYLNASSKEGDIFCVDIGQNQMWTAQKLKMKKNQKFMTSGGLAPMGYALPASVGVAFANENQTVYSISGDGGFHMAIQSLMLISQYNLPVKVIVMNNKSLGMITQFQELYFEKRLIGTVKEGGYLVPNLEDLAKAYNINYYLLDNEKILDEDLRRKILEERNCLIEYRITGETKVYPKLEFDKGIENMSPQLSEEELEDIMIIKK